MQYGVILIALTFIPRFLRIRKQDYVVWLTILFQLYILSVTICNGVNVKTIIHVLKLICGTVAVYSLGRLNLKAYLKAVYIVGQSMLVLNTISCFVFKNGILRSETGYPVYYLGTRNSMGAVITYLIVVMLIHDDFFYHKIEHKTKGICIIGALGSIILWSATTIIAFAIILIYVMSRNNKLIESVLNKIDIWIAYLIGLIGFFVINVFRLQEMFSFFIESVLRRNVNFTARTYIWDKDLELIKENPIFGYGQYDKKLIMTAYFQPENAHNFFFELLLMGGIIGFIIFTTVIIKSSSQLRKLTNKSIAQWISCYFLVIMITGIAESTILNFGIYAILSLANVLEFEDDDNHRGDVNYE